jgi:hypothetical protein
MNINILYDVTQFNLVHENQRFGGKLQFIAHFNNLLHSFVLTLLSELLEQLTVCNVHQYTTALLTHAVERKYEESHLISSYPTKYMRSKA